MHGSVVILSDHDDNNLPEGSESTTVNVSASPSVVIDLNDTEESTAMKLDCPICYQRRTGPEITIFEFACQHSVCTPCFLTYVRSCIEESRIKIQCPDIICSQLVHPTDLHRFLLAHNVMDLWSKYERFCIRQVLVRDPETRWCPGEACNSAVLAPSSCAKCPHIQCLGCGSEFCYTCRQYWHPGRLCVFENADRGSQDQRETSRHDEKPCPQCQTRIFKTGGCNLMTCEICSTKFCWICCQEIDGWFHFTGDDGCPYYGQRSLQWYHKLGLQSFICLLSVPALPLLAVCLALAAIPATPYHMAKSVYQSSSELSCARKVFTVALVSIASLPLGLLISGLVLFGVMVLGSLLVCLFLPISWFVDMRNLDAQHVLQARQTNPKQKNQNISTVDASVEKSENVSPHIETASNISVVVVQPPTEN